MLLQLVFFIVMLFAVAALTIDMGIVRLTQSQMQNAADTGALEGLRFRDDPACAGDATCLEEGRRDKASKMVSWVFDPNFEAADDPTISLGAGPLIGWTDGTAGPDLDAFVVRDLNASQTIDPSSSGAYKPHLETNSGGKCPDGSVGNCVNGDLVSGTFGMSTPTPGFPDEAACGEVGAAREDCTYKRNDFNPATIASSPAADAFLVRLRRTSDFQGLDSVDSVSSKGEPLPLLFGSTFLCPQTQSTNPSGPCYAATPSPNGYNPRVNGITVRATAIAHASPALRVGTAAPGLPGVTPFAFRLEFWQSLAEPNNQTCLTVDVATGVLNAPFGPAGKLALPATTVGIPVLPPSTNQVPSIIPDGGYVPIYGPSSPDVIGFGFIQLTSPMCIGNWMFEVTRTSLKVAPANATALVTGGLQIHGLTLLTATDGPLLVPVLSR